MSSVGPAFSLIFLVGAAWIAVNVAAEPLVLRLTARDFVGRVTAVLTPAGTVASILSAALAGSLVSTLLHGFHATILHMQVGPVDACLVGSVGVRLLLHDVRFADEPPVASSKRDAARTPPRESRSHTKDDQR